jgi:hypothetical protein
MKYNILKDEIYRTSYLICESLFLEDRLGDEEGEEKIEDGKRREKEKSIV